MAKKFWGGLVKRKKIYYCRFRVPAGLAEFFGRTEIKRSLNTDNLPRARRMLRSLQAQVDTLYQGARMAMALDSDSAKTYARQFLREELDQQEARRVTQEPCSPAFVSAMGTIHNLYLSLNKLSLAQCETLDASHQADQLLIEKGHGAGEIDRSSEPYRLLCRELLKSNVEYRRIEIERLGGNYSNDYDRFLERAASHTTSTFPAMNVGVGGPTAVTLNTLAGTGGAIADTYEMYVGEKEITWDAKNAKDVRYAFRLFREIVGEKDIKDYVLKDFMYFKSRLAMLPVNCTRKKELKHRNIVDLIAEVEADKLAEKTPRYKLCDRRTQSKQLERISWFFNWCVTKSLLLVSFAEGLGYTKKQIDAKPVRSHTQDELQAIVDNLEIKRSRPERFFIPLFGLYQGVRQNEGCQLFVRDIVRDQETKLLCANITEDDETGQKTKNMSSRRLIPIHPFILELGFENYWKQRKALDTDPANPLQLWPNTNLGVNGYTGAMSNWWGRFVDANVTKCQSACKIDPP